jgi:RNA polymerase sigma factor (TIGR02999 family)
MHWVSLRVAPTIMKTKQMDQAGEITQLLRQWNGGDPEALAPLFEMVYPQLKQIAQALFRNEKSGALSQPTSIVNELYVKLLQQNKLRLADRQHFFNLAARLMRRLLVDHARSEGRLKRNGGIGVSLEEGMVWQGAASPSVLDLDRVLDELQAIDDRKCRIIELRFFLGFTLEETAELVGLSKASVERELKFSRAWLYERLQAAKP